MKKVLFLLLITFVFVVTACSKPELEIPIESYFPTSTTYSMTDSSSMSSSEVKIVKKESLKSINGTIELDAGQLNFNSIENSLQLKILEEKCKIYLMVLDMQTDIMQSFSKQQAEISILTNGLEVDAIVKTIITIENGSVTAVEYCEIVEINVYPKIMY